jgi:predicted dehydrogenase
MKNPIRIGLVGSKFMGRAHSNAWKKAASFFEVPLQPVLQIACARHQKSLEEFAAQWGWQQTETDWKKRRGHRTAAAVALRGGDRGGPRGQTHLL